MGLVVCWLFAFADVMLTGYFGYFICWFAYLLVFGVVCVEFFGLFC